MAPRGHGWSTKYRASEDYPQPLSSSGFCLCVFRHGWNAYLFFFLEHFPFMNENVFLMADPPQCFMNENIFPKPNPPLCFMSGLFPVCPNECLVYLAEC